MAVPRSESERERDRLLISDLYLQGYNQQEIADKLGLHRNTVGSDIKFLLGVWRKQRNGLVDEFEGKYRFIYREAIAAWKRSLEDAEVEVSEVVEDSEGKDEKGSRSKTSRMKASTRKEGQSGNPALLAQAQAAMKAIREMIGVDAAIKQNIEGNLKLAVEYTNDWRDTGDTPTEEN